MLSSVILGCPETSFQNYWNWSKDSSAIWAGFNTSENWRFSIPLPIPTTPQKCDGIQNPKNEAHTSYKPCKHDFNSCTESSRNLWQFKSREWCSRSGLSVAWSSLTETVYPFSLAVSPELMSSFPCSWNLPTEINIAALRSAYPVMIWETKR